MNCRFVMLSCLAVSLASSLYADYIIREGDEWRPLNFDVTKIEPGSVLDFGTLLKHHRPAGKYGFLKVVENHFEFEKLPGVKQRFFGVNLCNESSIPTKSDAVLLAESIARAGYNSVRLHHYDDYIVKKSQGSTTTLDPVMADRLDFFLSQLKNRGIYVTLDLYCSRSVDKAEMPEVYHPVGLWNYKNAVYLLNSARENFFTFSRNLMTHTNAYTGLRYADDPMFCFISTLNENRVLVWNPKNNGARGWQWEQYYQEWCDRKFIDKMARGDEKMRLRFLGEFVRAHTLRMNRTLREMGLKTPLTDQNNGGDVLTAITREHNDYTDMHFYHGHPIFPGNSWRPPCDFIQKSWIESLTKYEDGTKAIASRTHGRPYTLTELRWCKPLRARGEGGAIMGALAGFQDWDALFTFQWAYGGNSFMKEAPGGYFDLYGDPISYLSEHMIHLLFLRGDMPPAGMEATILLPGDAGELDPSQPQFSTFGRALGMLMKVGNRIGEPPSEGLWWRHGDRARIDEIRRNLEGKTIGRFGRLDMTSGHVASPDGEMELLAAQGIFKINTSRSEGLVFVKPGCDETAHMKIDNHSPYTTFFIASLDRQPLKSSRRLLFLHLNDAEHSHMRFEDISMSSLKEYGGLPHLARRATGDVTLQLEGQKTPIVYAVNLRGQRIGEIPSRFQNRQLTFTANTFGRTETPVLVYEIVR